MQISEKQTDITQTTVVKQKRKRFFSPLVFVEEDEIIICDIFGSFC